MVEASVEEKEISRACPALEFSMEMARLHTYAAYVQAGLSFISFGLFGNSHDAEWGCGGVMEVANIFW